MSSGPRSLVGFFLAFVVLFAGAGGRAVLAATYLPLSDEELARRAPVIVRARVLGQETRRTSLDGRDDVLTTTRFEPLEVLKGSIGTPTFAIELPGGVFEGLARWVPGTPSFSPGGEVILFLAPAGREPGFYGLTEFGLSKFELVEDTRGRLFARRGVFSPEEDDFLSGRDGASGLAASARRPLREAGSFLAALRAAGSEQAFPEVAYARPDEDASAPSTAGPSWVNIGGTESGNRLYRWFWDTGRSPAARVVAAGTQSGLSDSSDGVAFVTNAANAWARVPGANVRYSPIDGTAQVVVNLDVSSHSPYWSEPLPCTSGGIIGLGGPGAASSAGSYKGDANYYAATSGNVWMRKVTGGCYSWQTFRTAVLHEVGHTLGLGHSDQGTSIHSTTPASDWSSAVMTSSIPPSRPSEPQEDDIAGIQWLYGAASTAAPTPDRPRPLLSTRRPH